MKVASASCSRGDAGAWLSFLATLGYELSAIEQAVADGVPYAGDDARPTEEKPGQAADTGGEGGEHRHAHGTAQDPDPGTTPHTSADDPGTAPPEPAAQAA